MVLHGNMVIELTDVNTGEVETIEENNMITNAINNIFGLNPMGVWNKNAGQYDDLIVWNDNLLPICPNLIGGILMFSSTLTEDVDNLYPSSANLPVAYASNDVNATTNTARGSLNLTESYALTDGYKFVWEFTAAQGNGTIAAVGLTSAQGGTNGWGSSVADDTPFLYIKEVDIGDLTDDEQMALCSAVEVDFENGLLYSFAYASSTVTISKYRIPVFDIGLNEKLDDSTVSLLDTTVLTCSTFKFYRSYTPYGAFIDGQDGYWYGFSNTANSSGDATVLWIKISKTDYSFTEGTWTLSNATLAYIGSLRFDSYPKRDTRAVIRSGYLYVLAYDKTGMYKINLSNSADVTLISFGFTASGSSLGGSGMCTDAVTLIGDLIIGYDFQIDVNDNVIATVGSQHFEEIVTPVFQYKNFLVCWCSSYGNESRRMYLLTPYLATINNLSTAVVKTTDKTMKITYTLTQTDS